MGLVPGVILAGWSVVHARPVGASAVTPARPGGFEASGASYDLFMGRYSRELAAAMADATGVAFGLTVAEVGCGPGALTAELASRLGADRVRACDPSPSFVQECRQRNPGVEVVLARAEALPWPPASVDVVLSQLVLHFVADPEAAAREAARVLLPGGVFGACVWDFAEGMEMLRAFWDAAVALDANAPDEARTMRFGRAGELTDLLAGAGLVDIRESTLTVESGYAGFDELWDGFLQGVGPAGGYAVSVAPEHQRRLREALFDRLDRPQGSFTLRAVARSAVGRR